MFRPQIIILCVSISSFKDLSSHTLFTWLIIVTCLLTKVLLNFQNSMQSLSLDVLMSLLVAYSQNTNTCTCVHHQAVN